MSDQIEIPRTGGNAVHVFSLGLADEAAEAFVARPPENGSGWPLKVALGAERLVADEVAHFPLSDLAGLGLSHYLTEGMGADPAAVERDTARLDALRGEVVILRPASFGGTEQVLSPTPPLVHVGSYPLMHGATTMEKLRTPSATGEGAPIARTPPPTSRWVKWAAALAAFLIVVGILVLLTGGFA
ncbi:hypothetical protein [Pseudooceanicola sp. LIPI14-2-Ac024]|uniref:hypothetical protein n=1 Tax=Pseudooceanicola sp. LIPI14-2-Ac024 TaxID=3344875 RepID=UPI0035D03739